MKTQSFIISGPIDDLTKIDIIDESAWTSATDGVVELHVYFPYIKCYTIFIVPESWEIAQDAITGKDTEYLRKIVYRDPCIADPAQYDENIA